MAELQEKLKFANETILLLEESRVNTQILDMDQSFKSSEKVDDLEQQNALLIDELERK